MAKKVRLPFVVAHPVSFPTVDDLVPTLVLEREDFDPRVVEEAILADVLEIATTVVAESVGVGVGADADSGPTRMIDFLAVAYWIFFVPPFFE